MSAAAAPESSESRARVLVVDDDDQVRQILTLILLSHGWTVDAVASAEDALAQVGDSPPDLLLLDLHLPGRTGLEVLEEIRSAPSTRLLPVIMITGDGTREDRIRALSAGVTDFFPKPFDPEELSTRIRALLRLKALTDQLEEAEHVIVALARTVDARDPYTAGHSERVAGYARGLGLRLKLPPFQLEALTRGARFHDIGKIAVPDCVLQKPGRLTSEEYTLMKHHPIEGRRLLEPLRTLAPTIPVVYHHHERMDGSGYPDGLAGADIPLPARIVAIADVYDALTTHRSYRPAHPGVVALRILHDEARRGWWDPHLVREFEAEIASPSQRGNGKEARVRAVHRPGSSPGRARPIRRGP